MDTTNLVLELVAVLILVGLLGLKDPKRLAKLVQRLCPKEKQPSNATPDGSTNSLGLYQT